MNAPRLLALVPARGGSKGLPGKNIKPLAGLPLIGWTLRAAVESRVAERLIVTTDSPEIAETAAELGHRPPWLRPAELAGDRSPSIDFVLHALDRLEADDAWLPDAVLLLQPTSPLRRATTVRAAVEEYARSGADSLASMSPARTHPWSCWFAAPNGTARRAVPGAPEVLRRQDLPPAYEPDGSIYITSVERLRRARSFLGEDTLIFATPPDEAIDIDGPEDWARAEAEAIRRGGR